MERINHQAETEKHVPVFCFVLFFPSTLLTSFKDARLRQKKVVLARFSCKFGDEITVRGEQVDHVPAKLQVCHFLCLVFCLDHSTHYDFSRSDLLLHFLPHKQQHQVLICLNTSLATVQTLRFSISKCVIKLWG